MREGARTDTQSDRPPSLFAASERSAASDGAAASAGKVDIGEVDSYIGFHLRTAHEASLRAFIGASGEATRPGRFTALAVIGLNPGIGQAALGRAIVRDKSTVTPLLQELQRLGLINRRPCPRDRRRIELYLTESGRNLVEQLRPCVLDHDRRLGDILGPRKAEFIDLLRRITREMD